MQLVLPRYDANADILIGYGEGGAGTSAKLLFTGPQIDYAPAGYNHELAIWLPKLRLEKARAVLTDRGLIATELHYAAELNPEPAWLASQYGFPNLPGEMIVQCTNGNWLNAFVDH
ncbi:MAG: hypothetical protein AB1568_04760 [Thermodesulfobacteriota bacterium]